MNSPLTFKSIASLLIFFLLAGCGTFHPNKFDESEFQYVCRPGSAIKHREPTQGGFPDYWIPKRKGSCLGQ